jgi:hypothetical protein
MLCRASLPLSPFATSPQCTTRDFEGRDGPRHQWSKLM